MRRVSDVFVVLIVLLFGGRTVAFAQSPEENLAAASALFDAQKYAEAAQKLDTFLMKSPKHLRAGAAALALGRCRSELKQFALAIPAYEKAIATNDSSLLLSALLGLGEAAMSTRQFEKAATALEGAMKQSLKPEQSVVVLSWLGQARFQLKQFALAEEAYSRVIREYRKSEYAPEAYFGAGLSALRQKKTDSMRQLFQVLIERYPKSPDRPQAMLLLAQTDLDAKRYGEARSQYEALLRDAGAKTAEKSLLQEAEDGLIQTLLALEDYNAAIPRLESVLARLPASDPQRFRAQLSLGHCRSRQKQYAPALNSYQEAAKSPETMVAAQGAYWTANTQFALDRPAEAGATFRRFATQYPKHELAPRALRRAGEAFESAKQSAEATSAYRALVSSYPSSSEATAAKKALTAFVEGLNDPTQLKAALKSIPVAERPASLLRLARLYIASQKYVEAGEPLAELVQIKPASEVLAEAKYLQAMAWEALSKTPPPSIVSAYEEAIRLAPKASWSAQAFARLAWLYLDLKTPQKSEKAANSALESKPNPDVMQEARLAWVQSQLDQERWENAMEGCRLLLEGNPSPATLEAVHFLQAWTMERRGKPEEALPLWEKVASEHPKSRYAAEALLHVGDARLKAEKHEEARTQYALLLSNFPQSPLAIEARFKLGSALYSLSRYEEAVAAFALVIADKKAGDYLPESLYWSGVAFEKLSKKESAIQYLMRLVTQYPNHSRVKTAKIRLAALKAT
jgi:TolA-binding protein